VTARSLLEGNGFRLRRATVEDVHNLVALAARSEVADFLAALSPWAEEDVRVALAADATEEGRFVLEVEEEGLWQAAGGLAFSVANRRSRIAYLFGVMVDPSRRGRGLAERSSRLLAEHLIRDLGYHRVQLEVYGFNERAQRVFERAGFVREGARRKAYLRHGDWHDGVLFGLVEEDLPGQLRR
jgi:RimJ/RimL family protein N-acetyltransferase